MCLLSDLWVIGMINRLVMVIYLCLLWGGLFGCCFVSIGAVLLLVVCFIIVYLPVVVWIFLVD